MLDEPTNHLDLPAIEQLEVALDAFGGTVVLVTHDRSLLERVNLTRRIELANGRVPSVTRRSRSPSPSEGEGATPWPSPSLTFRSARRRGAVVGREVAEQRRLKVRHQRVHAVMGALDRVLPGGHELERRLELGEIAGLDEHLELGPDAEAELAAQEAPRLDPALFLHAPR